MITSPSGSRTIVMVRGNTTPGPKRVVPYAHHTSSKTRSISPNTRPAREDRPAEPIVVFEVPCVMGVQISCHSGLRLSEERRLWNMGSAASDYRHCAFARTLSPTHVAEYQTILAARRFLRAELNELYAQIAVIEGEAPLPRTLKPSRDRTGKELGREPSALLRCCLARHGPR